jgi:hypothetical protein
MQTQTLNKTMTEIKHLIYCLEKMIPMYMVEVDKEPKDMHVFMCQIARNLESEYHRNLMLDYLQKDRPTFNYWVKENFTYEIINPNNYEVFLCSRPGYDVAKLNEIRFLYLYHLLTKFKTLFN